MDAIFFTQTDPVTTPPPLVYYSRCLVNHVLIKKMEKNHKLPENLFINQTVSKHVH